MRKPVMFLFGVLLAAVGWIIYENFQDASRDPQASPSPPSSVEQEQPGALAPLAAKVKQLLNSNLPLGGSSDKLNDPDGRRIIRIGTLNASSLNETKSHKANIMDILARIVRQFDVIAIQEIQSRTDDVLPRLVDLVNVTGQQYDFVIGPRLGPEGVQEQYAFVFNRSSVVIDRAELYTVDDQDDLIIREPLVAWFRTVGPDPNEAFTFSLVNIKVDPTRISEELNVLDDILYAVQDDGREEDDVILIGDFQAAPRSMGELDQIADVAYAINNVPTNTEGNAAWSNVVLRKTPTVEFNGRGGVYDFLREYNLTLSEAIEVSDHLPIWAEFSIYEGGQPGHVARKKKSTEGELR